jgi:hypothetical protein
MDTCTPIGTLAPITLVDALCACGVVLHPVPAGDEWGYVDSNGLTRIDTSPQALRQDPRAWWDWLATEHIGTYSRLSAAINLGCFSFIHVHRQAPGSGVGGPYDVPSCHEQPMQYVPSGWRCRVRGVVFAPAELHLV